MSCPNPTHQKTGSGDSSCNASHIRVRRVSPSPGLGVPSGLGRMVVGVILLLLVLSGDVEANPGPVGKFLITSRQDRVCMLRF